MLSSHPRFTVRNWLSKIACKYIPCRLQMIRWENSASKLMTDLKWENLSARRKTARLSVFHKALGGHLALPVQNYLRPTQRITRQAQSTNTFIQPACRLDVFKFSYIPQTARDWNKLPLNITSIENTDQLKTQISRLISKAPQQMD